jgi:hypothetical protein
VEAVPGYGWAQVTASEQGLEAPEVEVDPTDGTVTVDGVAGLDRLVAEEDLGDTYTASPGEVLFDRPTHVAVMVLEYGPLRRRVRVIREHDRGPTVTTIVETRAGEKVVRFTTSFDNRRVGHRVRAWFPLPERASHSSAECAFAIVRRGLVAEGGEYERAAATFPSRRFVRAGGDPVHGFGRDRDQLAAHERRDDLRELVGVRKRGTPASDLGGSLHRLAAWAPRAGSVASLEGRRRRW